MPPKANADAANGAKMVPADCVAVLLMAIGSTSISKAQYDMMSALDGTRTASSFEHQFRSITTKAKELKARVDGGETFEPVQPTKKRAGGSDGATPPVTPKKAKATPKTTPKSRKKVANDAGYVDDISFPAGVDGKVDLVKGILVKDELEDTS